MAKIKFEAHMIGMQVKKGEVAVKLVTAITSALAEKMPELADLAGSECALTVELEPIQMGFQMGGTAIKGKEAPGKG